MKKKEAKVFKKHGEGKVEIVKNYTPVTKKEKTTAIKGARKDINNAVGNVLLNGSEKEQKIVGKLMTGDYFEDWDFDNSILIKY